MKKTHRIIAFLMTLVILFGIVAEIPVEAASTPTWTKISTSGITNTDAKIGAKATFSSKVQFSKGGFYIGTSKDNMHKNAYPDSTTTKSSTITFTYLMSKYKETLKPNTTYYYRIYVVAGGKEYKSPVYSFKTTNTTQKATWSKISTTDITDTDAKIGAKVTMGSTVQFSKGGFYIGTSKSNMKKNAYPDSTTTKSKTISFTYLMSKYKETIRPGTTYYYQIYIVADGKEYKSPTYSFKTTGDAKAPLWSTSVSADFKDATLTAKASFAKKTKVTKASVYFGTSKTNLKKIGSFTSSSTTTATYKASVKLSKLKQTLSPGKTYYYKYAVVVSGKTYYSPVYSFKTRSAENYVKSEVTNITKTNAKIGFKVSNGDKDKITAVSLQLGLAKDDFDTVKSYKLNTTATSLSYSLDLNKCGFKLKKGTTYYYRVKMTIDGVSSYTTVRSFETEPDATKLVFPLPTNKVWYASTYVGHGGKNKSAYSSVDITLKNGKSAAGYAVYSMADGVVHQDKYAKSDGQITIKYTTTLITTNGAKYTTWYATYAHMTNITVKKGDKVKAGQQIGKVGSVGKSTGPHLHLSIGSGNGGTSWYQEKTTSKAISPYYIYGFVTAKGEDTSYLVRDKKGTGVTNQLINHKPSGK